jgi:hypothetical protein
MMIVGCGPWPGGRCSTNVRACPFTLSAIDSAEAVGKIANIARQQNDKRFTGFAQKNRRAAIWRVKNIPSPE